jgi:hypothetical protein
MRRRVVTMPISATATSSPPPEYSGIEIGDPPSFGQRLKDLFLGQKAANAAVALAIVIGFFHGWLKLKIRHPISTFLFDIPLIIALMLTFFRLKTARDWLPPSRSGKALAAFYVVITIWFFLSMVLPWGAPLIAAVAALRGWVFSTLMFGLGYHIIVSRRQLHGYFILIILLAAATAFYATRQSLEEVEAMRALDPYFETMTRGQGYVDDEGRLVLRRFSTFISSGAFGGTMAVSLLFLAALLTDPVVARKEKLILVILALLIGWGMSLSGSRSSLLAFGLGLIIIIWYRRLQAHLFLLGGAFAAALVLAAKSTEGGVFDRFSQFDLQTVWGRFYVVWAPGTRYLFESNFLGGGLGKAGVGFPVSLARYFGHFKMWGVDGDLGKTMAELGIVGVVIMIVLLYAALRDGFGILQRRRNDSVGTMALGAVCAFAIATVTFPIGSPFIGIPLGVLTWFFLGAAVKLDLIERTARDTGVLSPEQLAAQRATAVWRLARPEPGDNPNRDFDSPQARPFLFRPPPTSRETTAVVTSATPPDVPTAGRQAPTPGVRPRHKKRFLYRS